MNNQKKIFRFVMIALAASLSYSAQASDISKQHLANKNSPASAASTKASTELNTPTIVNIEFPKTGKKVSSTRLIYGVDYDFVLKDPVGQMALKIARREGVTGTDAQVLNKTRANSQLLAKIWQELGQKKLPSSSKNFQDRYAVSGFFESFALPGLTVEMTDNFIKTKTNTIPGLASKGALGTALSIDVVEIVDLDKNTSNLVGSGRGVLFNVPKKDFAVENIFALADMTKKQLKEEGAKSEVTLNKEAFGYLCNIVKIEVPVRPKKKASGKNNDSLLYMHSLLTNKSQDYINKNYNSRFKNVITLYYTHDLDNILPPAVVSSQNMTNVAGYFVAATITDENGLGVTYKLQNIAVNQEIDTGEFQIPAHYPVMTMEEMSKKVAATMGF